MSTNTDRNLLFGFLALQNDFISREELIAAVSVWLQDKSVALDQILLRRKSLPENQHELLQALLQVHLERHEGDPQKSLAALSSVGSVRDELSRLSDADVDATVSLVGSARTDQELETAATLLPGADTGGRRFRILRPHAKGGLGEVFVAQDEELKREVALKEIQAQHVDNPDSRARFVLEAEITGALEHPGIVPVYGLGQYADGRPYYAMRFIRGDSLKDAIARFHTAKDADADDKALQLRKLLGRFIDICNAIQYAHSRGVLHRDLKPGNVMLGKYGETLVVDWGLAKLAGRDEKSKVEGETTLIAGSGSGSTPTQMGSAIGTPAYMPPEQASGKLDDLGPASDVYSLGATLYHLLTGQSAFTDKDLGTVLKKVERGDFPAPRQVKSDVPKPLEAICLKAMATDPSERYSSPQMLADDVERFLADEPVSAHHENFADRIGRWGRRHSALVRAAAISLFAIAVVSIVAVVFVNQERQRAERLAKEKDDLAGRERAARVRADELAEQSRQQLVQLTVDNAQRMVVDGDALGAMPWIAKALKLDEGDSKREEPHRIRLAAILQNCNQPIHIWFHDAAVTHAGFNADGSWALTASADGTVRIWDTASGDLQCEIQQDATLQQALFSPDGRRIATASAHQARVWQASDGSPISPLLDHAVTVNDVQFDPSGRRVVTACEDGRVRLWDAETGERLFEMEHGESAEIARFSPSAEIIASTGSGKVHVWDAATGELIVEFGSELFRPHQIAFSPDSKQLATAGFDGVRVWDARTGAAVTERLAHTGQVVRFQWQGREEESYTSAPVVDVAFSADGNLVASASSAGTARVWNASTGKSVGTPLEHENAVVQVNFSPDGRYLITASGDGSAQIWEAVTGRRVNLAMQHGGPVARASFSPHGQWAITAGQDGTARLWNVIVGEFTTVTLRHGVPPANRVASAGPESVSDQAETDAEVDNAAELRADTSVVDADFSPDGKQVASAGDDGIVRVWAAESGKLLFWFNHGGHIDHVSYSDDGKLLRVADLYGTARIWDATTGQPLTKPLQIYPRAAETQRPAVAQWSGSGLPERPVSVEKAVVSQDGERIVTVSGDRGARIRVWDFATRQLINAINDTATHVSISPDGNYLLTSKSDLARVWEIETGELVTAMKHRGNVLYLAFTPNGEKTITISADGMCHVWNAFTGEPLKSVSTGGEISLADLGPDGQRLVVATAGNQARIWNVADGGPVTGNLLHESEIHHVCFRPDGNAIATGCADGTVHIWDAGSGARLLPPLEFFPPPRVDVNGDQDDATANDAGSDTRDEIIKLFAEAARKQAAEKPPADVNHMAFSPDGSKLATASESGYAQVWDARTGEPIGKPLEHSDEWQRAGRKITQYLPVRHVAFSPDGGRVLTYCPFHFGARVWDANSGDLIWSLEHDDDVNHAVFSPQGNQIVTCGSDGKARLWNASDGQPFGEPLDHGTAPERVPFAMPQFAVRPAADDTLFAAFSHDSRQLLTVRRGIAQIWDVHTLQKIGSPIKQQNEIAFAAFSPDDRRLVTADENGTARVWDAATSRPVSPWIENGSRVAHATFSPDGNCIVTAGDDARIWDARTGNMLLPPIEHSKLRPQFLVTTERYTGEQSYVNHVQFSPNGEWIVTASGDGTARVWDAQSGEPLTPPLEHRNRVKHASFSRDGRYVLTVSDDETARVWDAKDGAPVTQPLKHPGILKACLHPDSRRALTIGTDLTARLWRMEPAGAAADKLILWSRLLAARRLDPTGGYDWMDKAETRHTWQLLQAETQLQPPAASSVEARIWWRQEARICENLGQWFAARFYLDQMIGDQPNDGTTYFRRARVHTVLQDWEAAAADCTRAIELAVDDHQVWWLRGLARVNLGQWQPAINDLSSAINLHDDEFRIWWLRAQCETILGNWQSAARDIEQAFALGAEQETVSPIIGTPGQQIDKSMLEAMQATIYFQHAVLQLKAGDLTGYRDTCRQTLWRFRSSEQPKVAGATAWLCVLAPRAVLEPEDVVELATNEVEQEPADAGRRSTLGAALFRAGRYFEAVQQLDRAVNLRDGEGTVADWLMLAISHHRLRHKQEAEEFLNEASQKLAASHSNTSADFMTATISAWDRLQYELLAQEARDTIVE